MSFSDVNEKTWGAVHHVSMKHNTAILISSGTSRWLKIALRNDWEAARSNIAIVFDAHFSRGLPRRLRRWISTVKSKCRRNSISLGIHSISVIYNHWHKSYMSHSGRQMHEAVMTWSVLGKWLKTEGGRVSAALGCWKPGTSQPE